MFTIIFLIMNLTQRNDVSHVGKVYGKLTVLSYSHRVKYKSGSAIKFWNCSCECGRVTSKASPSLTSGGSKSCGCSRNKGGKVNNQGYMSVYDRVDRKYKLQHREVYKKHYGIKLKPHQNIHHINGNRLDNRIENLELWDTSQPSGQRIEDKIKYYFELVEDYRNHPKYKDLILSL